MIIIDDERRILNLNHMAIYLMLTAEEMAMYGDKLKRLNNYRRVTRGIFRFEIVEKGSTPYEQLPKEMTRGAARACNLLVRLVNSIHKIYCYGLDFVDMSLDSDSIHNELNLIVDEICRKNIFQLDILEYRNTGTAMSALQMYRNCNIVKSVFERALDGDVISKNDFPDVRMQRVSETTDLARSRSIAEDAFAGPLSDKIERERCERELPDRRPNISINLKNVPTGSCYKSGKLKMSIGLELMIDGDIVNVPITKIDQKMLYTAVLVAALEGKRLKRSDFTTDVALKSDFLKRVFRGLSLETTFTEWVSMVNLHGESARINDAKSKMNKDIWNCLPRKHRNAYYYVCLVTESPRTKDTRYKIRASSDRISIAGFISNRIIA